MEDKKKSSVSTKVFKIMRFVFFVFLIIYLYESFEFAATVFRSDGVTYLFWFSLAPIALGLYAMGLVSVMFDAKLDSKILKSVKSKYAIAVVTSTFLSVSTVIAVCFMFSFLRALSDSDGYDSVSWDYLKETVIYVNYISLLVCSIAWISGFLLIDCLCRIKRYKKELKESVTVDRGETSLVPEGTVMDHSPIMCPTGPEHGPIILGRDQNNSDEDDFANEEEDEFEDPMVIGESTDSKEIDSICEVSKETYDYLMSVELDSNGSDVTEDSK